MELAELLVEAGSGFLVEVVFDAGPGVWAGVLAEVVDAPGARL